MSTAKLNDSAAMRWAALGVVAFTMMAAYFVNDEMAPLKTLLESGLDWNSDDFGFYTGAYSALNVFFLMLIWGGFILDYFGVRFTGILSCALMVGGTAIQYYAITTLVGSEGVLLGHPMSVTVAAAGYSIFGVGAEVAGITVTKIIAKWFKGKEMATAMGVQVALARIGSLAGYAVALPVAKAMGVSFPTLMGLMLLLAGLVTFIVFNFMDKKLDNQLAAEKAANAANGIEDEDDEKFNFKDVLAIIKNPGFWLIALLCVLFYSCVFPFQKYATEIMVMKYGVSEDFAGFMAGLPALGALVLTPVFGGLVDRMGKAASIMLLGSALLIAVHFTFAIPTLTASWVAIALMVLLGIAFSLVPSAMWPSVAKIFPARQLGTAYALIFFVQNLGLLAVPMLIGSVLNKYCIVGQEVTNGASHNVYDYTVPMLIFGGLAVLSMIVGFVLKAVDKKNGYNLEVPNLK